MFLIDTSAWIKHFAKADPFDLRDVCPADERVLCLPVYREILQGIRNETAFRAVKEALEAAPFVEDPMGRTLFCEAAELYRVARRQGLTIRSATDCLIAACAVRHNLTVLHCDRDFPALATVSILDERAVS
ncbi:MAG: PIN domain-containing protein [Spirochaetales bacterium]|nr:PIN domain-containing protein [Spirochaetales bacterium]